MQEGDTELGGLQIPHGNNVNPPTPTPGPQPAASAVPQNPQPTPPAAQPASFESLQNTQNIQSTPSAPIQNNNLGIGRSLTSQSQFTPRQPQAQMTSSSMEDVVLGIPEPRKNKKGLIIGIIITVLVLVCMSIGATLLLKENTVKEAIKNKNTFNTYANYLLFGNAVDNIIDVEPNDMGDITYALDCEDKTQTECKDFFEEAKKLLDNFKNSNYQTGLSEESTSEVENYFSIFDKYYNYIIFGEMDDDTILAICMEKGYDGAIEYIKNYYNDLIDSGNTFLVNFGNYGIEKAKILIDNIKELEQAGCIVNGQNDGECMKNFKYSNDTIERIMDFEYSISNDMHISINDARNNLIYETVFIANLLQNGEKNDKK